MYDLVIKNGLVFDGLGNEPALLDVAIADGKVVCLAPEIHDDSASIHDARGQWVMPGFIDIHTHYDIEVEISPSLSESVRHGVTSVVMGNCSLSVALGEAADLADMFQRVETFPPELIQKWLKQAVSWRSTQEYFQHLHELPVVPNIAVMLGHSALRAHVMGLERSLHEVASDDEIKTMRSLARRALAEGFIGISIDMVPWHMMRGRFAGRTIPSQHADFREYNMLASVCREYDAVFQVTPNPQNSVSFLNLMAMASSIARKPLRMTVLSALDSVEYRHMWRLFAPMLFVFNRLLGANVRFQTLTEPFCIYNDGPISPIFEEMPSGVRLNDVETSNGRRELWQSPGFREKFRKDWLGGPLKTFHRRLDLIEIVECPDASLVGKSVTQVAKADGADPLDWFMDRLERYDTDFVTRSTGANDRLEPRLRLMKHPHILPGFTDSGAHVRNLGYYDGALNFLRQAVTTQFMPIERAVARVCGESARWFRLDTGVLAVGKKADVVILQPEHLRAPLSEQIALADPLLNGTKRMVKRDAHGVVDSVFVAGTQVVAHGEMLDQVMFASLGKVLSLSPDICDEETRARFRVSETIIDHPFINYWDVFVLKHQNWANIALHVIGVLLMVGVPALSIFLSNPWLLLLWPLSQMTGLLGHLIFEPNYVDKKDATFSWRATWSLFRLFFEVVKGRYGNEIKRVRSELEEGIGTS